MSADQSQPMGFGEFCNRLNNDPQYMQRYRKDPAGVIEEALMITLSDEQKNELKQTVDAIFDAIPGARFYVAGQKFPPPPANEPEPRPVPH